MIAHRWVVSEETVKTTLRRAYRKLGVNDKGAAIVAHQAIHGFCGRSRAMSPKRGTRSTA